MASLRQLSSNSTHSVEELQEIAEKAKLNLTISLEPKEAQIVRFLLDALQHRKLTTVMRIAGGWVRDKVMGQRGGERVSGWVGCSNLWCCLFAAACCCVQLLNKASDDIDIALDNMTGREFVDHLVAFAKSTKSKALSSGGGHIIKVPSTTKPGLAQAGGWAAAHMRCAETTGQRGAVQAPGNGHDQNLWPMG